MKDLWSSNWLLISRETESNGGKKQMTKTWLGNAGWRYNQLRISWTNRHYNLLKRKLFWRKNAWNFDSSMNPWKAWRRSLIDCKKWQQQKRRSCNLEKPELISTDTCVKAKAIQTNDGRQDWIIQIKMGRLLRRWAKCSRRFKTDARAGRMWPKTVFVVP
jgi:hypothetical protein